MSLNEKAIQLIQESANIPAVIEHVMGLETQVPIAVMPNSMDFKSLELLMKNASRYRLALKTTSIKDFIKYNALHDEVGATCFINSEKMSAKSIYDLGTVDHPLHKENTARLTLKRTAAFNALLEINERKACQKTAGEFIEDWEENIIVYTKNGDTMTPKAAARSFRDLTIEAAQEVSSKVDDFGERMSSMERIEAKNQEAIPAEIHFECDPYTGLKDKKFVLRSSILTGNDKPQISFRVLRLESIEEEMAEEFKDIISKASEELSLITFIGEV